MQIEDSQTEDIEAAEVLREFARRMDKEWRRNTDLSEIIDSEMWRIEDSLYIAGQNSRSEFLRVSGYVRRDIGYLPLFEVAECATATMRLIKESLKNIPQDVFYVFVGLATRAIATMREIAILLEHGFAFGARSRWRTLSEVLVVARVLVSGNRYTATRYIEHRWVKLAHQRKKTQDYAWSSDLPTPEKMVIKLRRRFGNSFDDQYGWAAQVVKQKLGASKPKWEHLTKLAKIADYESRVHEAHHAVHANSLGLLGTVDATLNSFHSGATTQGVMEVARDSVRLFRDVMRALIRNCIKHSQEREIVILQAIFEDHALACEISVSLNTLHVTSESEIHNMTPGDEVT